MPTYKNICPFCNQNDSPPTREHVLAEWISREFPGDATWIIENVISGLTFPSKQINLVTRKVCERCNTVWMRKLESAAKPLLIALMTGEQFTLLPEGQILIARWFAKTVMAHELLDKPPYYFQPSERKALESSLAVPAPTLFFLGRYVGPKPATTFAVHIPLTAGANTERPIPVDGYAATFTLKQLALQLFSLRVPPEYPSNKVSLHLPGNLPDMAVQIWPVIDNALRWTPPYYLEDEALEILKYRWLKLSEGPP